MSEDILKEVHILIGKFDALQAALYGRSASDPGDIPEIKAAIKNINGFKIRLIRLEAIVFVLASGGITGITKGMGWW